MNKLLNTALLVTEIGATGAMIYVAYRAVAGPDKAKLMRMKIFRGMETFCMAQAECWATLADVAESGYNRTRAVTL